MNKPKSLKWAGREIDLDEGPIIMGILNVTPDSFSDGGAFPSVDSALTQVERMLKEGASIIDVGGESTRPGAPLVSSEIESGRVTPVIRAIAKNFPKAIISVDTTKSSVARAALEVGAHVVNDVSGFANDPAMGSTVARFDAGCVLMFNARMDDSEGPIMERVRMGCKGAVGKALAAGVSKDGIVLDPGIGFGTSRVDDLDILGNLANLVELDFPVLLGASRKRVTGDLLNLAVDDRLETSLATTVAGVQQGVTVFRVHDVAAHWKAARMAKLIYTR